MEWQLQDAKNRLSQVVAEARASGPQVITLRGKRAAVVLSAEDYDSLKVGKPTFIDALLSGPEWDDEFTEVVNARSKERGRDVDL